MTYAVCIALGLLLWVVSTLVTHQVGNIALRVAAAIAFAVAVLQAFGVVS